MDAWNRQKTSAKEISATAADDVLALKGNHGTLPDEVQSFCDRYCRETPAAIAGCIPGYSDRTPEAGPIESADEEESDADRAGS